MFRISLTFLLIILTGCAGLAPRSETAPVGIDGIACVGRIDALPAQLTAINDDQLLQTALGASGEGKLCFGQVLAATAPVTVYRVWNSDKSYTRYGSWWSFELPTGPKSSYRRDNGICPSWSALDRLSSCELKPGAKIVVGPGQSARCKTLTYAKSAVNQVYIPNDARAERLFVENCTAGTVWP